MFLSLRYYHVYPYSCKYHYFLHSWSQQCFTFQESKEKLLWSYLHILIRSWVKEKRNCHGFLPTLTTSSILITPPSLTATRGNGSKEKQRGEGRDHGSQETGRGIVRSSGTQTWTQANSSHERTSSSPTNETELAPFPTPVFIGISEKPKSFKPN